MTTTPPANPHLTLTLSPPIGWERRGNSNRTFWDWSWVVHKSSLRFKWIFHLCFICVHLWPKICWRNMRNNFPGFTGNPPLAGALFINAQEFRTILNLFVDTYIHIC